MPNVAIFSDDTELRDWVRQLDGYQVLYFSTELDPDNLPEKIDLAIFDFDVVSLSLLDEWSQFPRLHIRKMAIVSAENLVLIDDALEQLDNYVVRPLSKNSIQFRVNQQRISNSSLEIVSMLPMELKTSFTAIQGYSDLIRYQYKSGEGILESDLLKYAGIIHNRAQHIERIIERITNAVRIVQMKQFDFSVHDLAGIVEHTRNQIRRQLKTKSQTLNITLPDKNPNLFCHHWYTIFVFREIINNASVYSAENTLITLNVIIEDDFILCAIQDRGIGISEEFKNRIFGRFEIDYEQHRIHDIGGIGLSLYLCKQIIEMHGGKIWFESELEVGTTFYFTLPLAE